MILFVIVGWFEANCTFSIGVQGNVSTFHLLYLQLLTEQQKYQVLKEKCSLNPTNFKYCFSHPSAL